MYNTGTIESISRDARYTHIHLEDGRTIKGKWNPAWGYKAKDVVAWTTYGSWNPNEWYDKVFLKHRPTSQTQRFPNSTVIGQVRDEGFIGRARKFIIVDNSTGVYFAKPVVVPPHNIGHADYDRLVSASRSGQRVQVEHFKAPRHEHATVAKVY